MEHHSKDSFGIGHTVDDYRVDVARNLLLAVVHCPCGVYEVDHVRVFWVRGDMEGKQVLVKTHADVARASSSGLRVCENGDGRKPGTWGRHIKGPDLKVAALLMCCSPQSPCPSIARSEHSPFSRGPQAPYCLLSVAKMLVCRLSTRDWRPLFCVRAERRRE